MNAKPELRIKLARGVLFFVLAIALILGLLRFFPFIVILLFELLNLIGFSIEQPDYIKLLEFLDLINPYIILILIIGFVYFFGRIVKYLTDDRELTLGEESQNPFIILINAFLKTISVILQLVSILADLIEGITVGILHAFEAIFDFIEKILELEIARILVGLVFISMAITWVYFGLFFSMDYIRSENLYLIIGIFGSLLMVYLCESCAHGILTRNSFKDVAIHQINNIGVIFAFFLFLFIPISLLLFKKSDYLKAGPISYFFYGLLGFFILFEFGLRLRKSIRR